MRRTALALAALLTIVLSADAQVNPSSLPSNTVVGRLGTSSGPAQAIPFNTLAANLLNGPLPSALTVPSVTINTTPNSTAQGLLVNHSISGVTFPGFAGGSGTASTAMDGIYISSDNGAVGAGILYDYEIVHLFGGSATTGGRVPLFSWAVQTAATNASNTNRNYTGGSCISDTRTGDGGTNTGAGALGAYFGCNPQVRLSAAATNVFAASATEFDNYGATGGTAKYNWGINIVDFTQVVGASSDAGLVFYSGNATGAYGPGLGWKQGISFAEIASNGIAPIASSGTVIGTHLESLSTFNVTNGVDFSNFTFSGNAWKSTGFQVSGTGNVTVGVAGQSGVPQIQFAGRTSQTATIVPQDTAGNSTLTLPSATGTLVSTAAAPVVINSGTGQVSLTSVGTGQAALAGYVGFVRIALTGINFNSANTDNAVSITLPTGISRYQVQSVRLSNASASITTATVGVFTATGGGGQTVAANQAITVNTAATDTNNNSLNLVITNAGTEAYNDATLQIRIGTAQGSAATADVVIIIVPLT